MQTKTDTNGLVYSKTLLDLLAENNLTRELPEFENEFKQIQEEKAKQRPKLTIIKFNRKNGYYEYK